MADHRLPVAVAYVDPVLCTGCRICRPLCPFGAIQRDEVARRAWVVEALCEGCGACVAACPSGALNQEEFSDQAILAQIDRFLADPVPTPGAEAAPGIGA